jgi:hypothetical protein
MLVNVSLASTCLDEKVREIVALKFASQTIPSPCVQSEGQAGHFTNALLTTYDNFVD